MLNSVHIHPKENQVLTASMDSIRALVKAGFLCDIGEEVIQDIKTRLATQQAYIKALNEKNRERRAIAAEKARARRAAEKLARECKQNVL